MIALFVVAGDTESVSQAISINEANKIIDDIRELLNMWPGVEKEKLGRVSSHRAFALASRLADSYQVD
jgi:CHASE3 domain sensor protein